MIYTCNIANDSEVSWLLLGHGRLGQAMVKAWMKRGLCNSDCMIVDRSNEPPEGFPGSYIKGIDLLTTKVNPRVVILALKPNQIFEAIGKYTGIFDSKAIWLSVMAGVKVKTLKAIIGDQMTVIRAMPNIASRISKSVTGIWNDKQIRQEDLRIVTQLLSAIGSCVWLSDEEKLDSITALTGSGPVYIYCLIEAMVLAAKEIGCDEFTESVASDLILGSIALLKDQEKDASELRKQVTSAGGTTEAAVSVLLNNNVNINGLVSTAIQAGKLRAKELAKSVNHTVNNKT